MIWNDVMRTLDWEPFTELRRLQHEMNRLFGEGNGGGSARQFPPVNVYTGKDDVQVIVEVPGVDPELIDISVLGDTLTLSGARKPEELKEGEVFHRQERPTGEFLRTIELPVRVNPDKVEARYASGILRVTLPRAEEDKPRQIRVKG
jgi:HSP20 family protein